MTSTIENVNDFWSFLIPAGAKLSDDDRKLVIRTFLSSWWNLKFPASSMKTRDKVSVLVASKDPRVLCQEETLSPDVRRMVKEMIASWAPN